MPHRKDAEKRVPSSRTVFNHWNVDKILGMEKIPEISLGEVGQCIYCYTDREPLSDEHIVPFGLNGPWKLRRASCLACAGITSAFERSVLKGPFNEARIAMRLPSRRKKNRPKQLPLSVKRKGQTQTVMLSAEDYPALIILPHFDTPAYLDQRDGNQIRATGQTTFQAGGRTLADLCKQLSANSIEISISYEPIGAFARMLAKIAYGFAVAAAGCDLSHIKEAYVLPAVLNKSDDVGCWVGGVKDEELVSVSDLHHISLTLVNSDILTRVRLFAQYNAPEYLIVVGRMANDKSLVELGLPQGAHWIY